jgi:hypothetical protein
MIRLRAHEKLQTFLHMGVVAKSGKEYSGVPKALVNYFKTTAETNARVGEVKQSRAALQSKVSAPRVVKVRGPIRNKSKAKKRPDML